MSRGHRVSKLTAWAYRCSEGHEVLRSPKAMTACPVYVHGQPCQGTLRQTAGPRK